MTLGQILKQLQDENKELKKMISAQNDLLNKIISHIEKGKEK